MNLAQLPENAADQHLDAPDGDPIAMLEALDCLRVAVTLYDSRERLIYLNRHFAYIFRAMPPAHALVGRSYEELVRLEIDSGEIAPDLYAGGEDAYIAGRKAQLARNDYAPRDIHMADGRIIEIKTRATADGGWIALWSDATSARHAMGRLGTAIELSADAFAFWDADDRLIMCNPEFAKLHGIRHRDDLQGERFEDLIRDVAQRRLVTLDGDAERLDRKAPRNAPRPRRCADRATGQWPRLSGARAGHARRRPRHRLYRRHRPPARRSRLCRTGRGAHGDAPRARQPGQLSRRSDPAPRPGRAGRGRGEEDLSAHDEP